MPWNGANLGGRRVAIVGGLRTPFVKSGTDYAGLTTLDLAAPLVAELIEREGLDPGEIDQVVFGQVVPSVTAPNIAREVALRVGLPCSVDAFSVVRACATSTQSLVTAAQAIVTGDADVVIAGGADSLSRPPITYRDNVIDALVKANNARGTMAKLKAFKGLSLKDILPAPPALTELSTGLTMGQSAEKMAKENGIAREDQDAFALRSHQRAAEAWGAGIYDDEVMRFRKGPGYDEVISKDGLVRESSSLERLGRLRPVFDRRHGTVTAGNSSPLTDGAAALVVMEEATAKRLGFEPKAFVKSWAFAGLDPAWQLLMGPAFASPVALDRAGLTLDQVDLVDMHEAFAAQMLSNLQAFKSKEWAEKHLGRDKPLGEVPDEKLNIHGGSISLGHPFAATGARQALTMANELKRRGGGTALVTQCAAGGLGAAVVLER
jgi:acetyl-CoA acyltransferase